MRPIVLVPGYTGSGPDHWQTHWQHAYPSATRVEQAASDEPQPDAWVEALDQVIESLRTPPVIVAHGLGCLVAVRWAPSRSRPVVGALLVAPPDLEQSNADPVLRRFSPTPLQPLPFPSILAASSDDPFIRLARARDFAEAWGSRLEPLGYAGHVNTEAGFGPWPEGERLLKELLGDTSRPRYRAGSENKLFSELTTK